MYTVSLVNRVGIRGNGGARRIAGNILRKLLVSDFVNFVGPRTDGGEEFSDGSIRILIVILLAN